MAHQFNPRDYSHHRGHGRGGRGRGRGRGGRGRYFDRNEDEDIDSRRGRGRGRHPSGLKGKDIGLWYARQSKKKTKHDEIKQRAFVMIDKKQEDSIRRLLAVVTGRSSEDDDTFASAQGDDSDLSYNDYEENEDFAAANDRWRPVASYSSESSRSEGSVRESSSSNSRLSQVDSQSSAYPDDEDDEEEDDANYADVELTEPPEDEDDVNEMQSAEADVDAVTPVMYTPATDEFEKTDIVMDYNIASIASKGDEEDSGQGDGELDEMLRRQQEDRLATDTRYQSMLRKRQSLPAYSKKEEIVRAVANNQVLVISGETGCGKTTQVPQFILDDFIERGCASRCRIICTQPRRISAISVAERVSEERSEACGSGLSCGYQIRLESRFPRSKGSIMFCTVGILLKWLTDNRTLQSVSHVVLDEVHERDLLTDFLMIILRDVLRQRRDLKVILMSATLNADMFSAYFGRCPMIHIPGFTFPVTEFFLEEAISMTRFQPQIMRRPKPIYGKNKRQQQEERQEFENWIEQHRRLDRSTKEILMTYDTETVDVELTVTLIEYIATKKPDGAVLVFVPGWEDISKINDKLQARSLFKSGSFRIIPLHSLMPTVNQREVFDKPPAGVRKIIIATNIAETSITIDDVVYVIDCGKIKMKHFDATLNLTSLTARWVSKANAHQRRGRAGRTSAGECYHLFTRYHNDRLADDQLPEIMRTRLEEICLQIKLLKLGSCESFLCKAMQPPSAIAVRQAIQLLFDLGALDSDEQLTALGRHLAHMPVDPQSGKMLLYGAMFSCLDPVCTIAASLSYRDAFVVPLGQSWKVEQQRVELSKGTQSDHMMLAYAYKGWEEATAAGTGSQYCWRHFLSPTTLRLLKDMRRQFAQLLCDMGFISTADPKSYDANLHSDNVRLVRAITVAGLYPNVARVKRERKSPTSGAPALLTTKTDRRVSFHQKSVNSRECNFFSPWFVYYLKIKSKQTSLHDSSVASPLSLLLFGGQTQARRDHGQECVVVDDWIYFRTSRRVARIIQELRAELERLLMRKAESPSPTVWSTSCVEGALMNAITGLLTSEEHCTLDS